MQSGIIDLSLHQYEVSTYHNCTSVTAAGATGKVDKVQNLEYGQQDFYGLIDEMRVWRRVRSEAEIKEVHRNYRRMIHKLSYQTQLKV